MTDAEKLICRIYLEDLDSSHSRNEYNLLMDLIDKAPATGKWIVNKSLNNRIQCSECGCFSGLNESDIAEGYELNNYCSNCGADMRNSVDAYRKESTLTSGYIEPVGEDNNVPTIATTVEYPCEDAVSREYLLSLARQDGAYDYVDAKQIADAPSVQPVGVIPCEDVMALELSCDIDEPNKYQTNLISCSDVIDAIGSWYDSGENNLYTIEEGYGVAERHLVDRIKKLPSQPVRQTGEWIKELERHFLDTRINDNVAMKEALGRGYHTYINDKCSCCNKIAIHDDTIYYEYCPHCGAKMEEG